MGISADDKKVVSLINASPPKNATEARSFLGFGTIPLTFHKGLLRPSLLQSVNSRIKMLSGVWGPEQQHAFDCLKASMATPEIMKILQPLTPKRS